MIDETLNNPLIVGMAVVTVLSVLFGFVPSLNNFVKSGSELKKRFVDDKFTSVLEESNEADMALKEELLEYVKSIEEDNKAIRTALDNDKRALDRHDAAITELQGRYRSIDLILIDSIQENTVLLKSVRAIMSVMIHHKDDGAIIEAMDEMDALLIERRKIGDKYGDGDNGVGDDRVW